MLNNGLGSRCARVSGLRLTMPVFLCLRVHLSHRAFVRDPRVNSSSLQGDLAALKVMIGNLSSGRKSTSRKTCNFPLKGRMIFRWPSVSYEKVVVKMERRGEMG